MTFHHKTVQKVIKIRQAEPRCGAPMHLVSVPRARALCGVPLGPLPGHPVVLRPVGHVLCGDATHQRVSWKGSRVRGQSTPAAWPLQSRGREECLESWTWLKAWAGRRDAAPWNKVTFAMTCKWPAPETASHPRRPRSTYLCSDCCLLSRLRTSVTLSVPTIRMLLPLFLPWFSGRCLFHREDTGGLWAGPAGSWIRFPGGRGRGKPGQLPDLGYCPGRGPAAG